MKRTASLILQITTLACLTHLTVTAQEPVSNLPKPSDSATSERTYDAEVELMRQDMRAKRKQIIAANLPLTEEIYSGISESDFPQKNSYVLSSRSKGRHDDQPSTRRTGSACQTVIIES